MATSIVFVLFVLAGFAILWIACARSAQRTIERFNERFPAISDAVYLARCSPGTDPQIALRVRGILAESLGVEEQRIYPSARLMKDLDAI
jgi:hypothetical protein